VSKGLDGQSLEILRGKLLLFGLNHLHYLVVVGISHSHFLVSENLILYLLHLSLGLFLLQLDLHGNAQYFSLRLSLDDSFSPCSLCLLFLNLLLLLCYPKGRPLGFNVLIVIGKGLWNGGLGDTNRDYFNARGPLVCIGLENFDKLLVEFIELIDEYFLECVLRAELIDLMMNLVIDPCLIIVHRVVLDGLMRQIFVQSIHHLYLVKVDKHSPGGTTWHIVYFISLHGDLHLFKGRDNGYF
jgi:hypothetical protein